MLVPKPFADIPPQITVFLDDTEDEILKKFHCVVCGKTVFEYYGNVHFIISGKHTQKRPKVVQCNNIVVMDNLTKQVVSNITAEEYNFNRDRYFKTKCGTKYWIS